MLHYSVMHNEVIEGLNIFGNGIYVDATLGYGGISKLILDNLNEDGLLICIDQDKEAIKYSEKYLSKTAKKFKIVADNFKNLESILDSLNISKIDGIVFDLGFSSPQIDDEKRGFSFMKDAPLDMRMDQDSKLTAKEVVNTYEEEKLVKCFFEYGEEKKAKLIAQKIIEIRKEKEIKTTLELVEVIKAAVGANYFYKEHPERKIFQALRILVNSELDVLKVALPVAINRLNKNGRIVVITFHSLEDRIVKKILKENSEVASFFKGLPEIPNEYKSKLRLVNKKPITPSKVELQENSRSHSAKLRIAERI